MQNGLTEKYFLTQPHKGRIAFENGTNSFQTFLDNGQFDLNTFDVCSIFEYLFVNNTYPFKSNAVLPITQHPNLFDNGRVIRRFE